MLSREQMYEHRADVAAELLADLYGAEPTHEDPRVGYVEVQIDRKLWLKIQALPTLQELALWGYPLPVGDTDE